jgi:hypothetical protein
VGGLNADAMVRRLRKEVGQSEGEISSSDIDYLLKNPPGWFDEKRIIKRFDASPIINSGQSPMNEILNQSNLLNPGEIFELRTPFVPAPIIDMLRVKDYKVYCIQNEDFVTSFISK